MEPWLEELIARGRQRGVLTFDEVNAAAPNDLTPERLAEVEDLLNGNGIVLVCRHTDPTQETVAEQEPVAELETTLEYHRNAEFDRMLRVNGVSFSDAMCSLESNGLVFDAELIVPGERALEAWLALRNLVSVTGLWPVILDQTNGPSFAVEPRSLDPGRRLQAWGEALRRDRNTPHPKITPSILRADATANVVESEKIPPTPWKFRDRSGEPPLLLEPDAPLEPSEPNFAELFGSNSPIVAHHQGFHPDWPFFSIPTGRSFRSFAFGCIRPPYPGRRSLMHRLVGGTPVRGRMSN